MKNYKQLFEEQTETITQMQREIEKSYSMLAHYGVPKERAKSVNNGIMVLITRMDKEVRFLNEEKVILNAEIERLKGMYASELANNLITQLEIEPWVVDYLNKEDVKGLIDRLAPIPPKEKS